MCTQRAAEGGRGAELGAGRERLNLKQALWWGGRTQSHDPGKSRVNQLNHTGTPQTNFYRLPEFRKLARLLCLEKVGLKKDFEGREDLD